MLRRVRSALSLGAIWAVVWLPFGVIVGLALTRFGVPAQSWRDFFSGLGVWMLVGALSGGIFALLVALFERSRTIHQLSPRRLALWGVIGGAAFPVGASVALETVFPNVHLASTAPAVFALMAALGALCGAGTLWLARRGNAEGR